MMRSPARPRAPARWHGFALALVVLAEVAAFGHTARAEDAPPPRKATFEWDTAHKELLVSMSFRDVVDDEIQKKLSRGLPTTIVFTGAIYRRGVRTPVSTTVQTCKITWHVWDEAYRVEITRPEGSRTRWTTTLEGVLRRCAEVSGLLAATNKEVAFGVPVSIRARVEVNPVSAEILEKIKLWVSRPARTGTAAPGDALFSTFTGIFMQRVGDAERTSEFVTVEAVPTTTGANANEG